MSTDQKNGTQSTAVAVAKGKANDARMPPVGASQHTKESLVALAAKLGRPLSLEGDGDRRDRSEAFVAGTLRVPPEEQPEPEPEPEPAPPRTLDYDAVKRLTKSEIEAEAASIGRTDVTESMLKDAMLHALFPDDHPAPDA